MKIALIILHADPARGGAERYTVDLAQGLARRGHEVTLVAASAPQRPAGVELVTLPPPRSAITRTGKYDHFCRSLAVHVAARGYDVTHAMLPVPACDVYHPHAGVAADALVTGHRKYASKPRRILAKIFSRWSARRRRFAHVERDLLTASPRPITICLSNYVADTVRKHYDLAPDDLATLFNSVDLAKYDPAARPGERRDYRKTLGVDDDTPVALIVAQDFARKGVKESIEALARLESKQLATRNSQHAALLVVGKDNPAPYQRLAERLGVSQHVHFAGATTDVYPAYAAADYFVLPTRHDPCSLVVLEALAMGLPVISTRQNGACEIMTPGQHGFVLDSAADVRGLATSMTALADPDTRLLMSNACLALRPRLSYDTHLATLEGIYARAVER